MKQVWLIKLYKKLLSLKWTGNQLRVLLLGQGMIDKCSLSKTQIKFPIIHFNMFKEYSEDQKITVNELS